MTNFNTNKVPIEACWSEMTNFNTLQSAHWDMLVWNDELQHKRSAHWDMLVWNDELQHTTKCPLRHVGLKWRTSTQTKCPLRHVGLKWLTSTQTKCPLRQQQPMKHHPLRWHFFYLSLCSTMCHYQSAAFHLHKTTTSPNPKPIKPQPKIRDMDNYAKGTDCFRPNFDQSRMLSYTSCTLFIPNSITELLGSYFSV